VHARSFAVPSTQRGVTCDTRQRNRRRYAPGPMMRVVSRLRATRRPELELFNRAPDDPSFITGNGFASLCRNVLNYGPAQINKSGRRGWIFCKGDRVTELFAGRGPRTDFVLFTHNSDFPVDAELAEYADHPRLRAWFGANVAVAHPRLQAIPLGIANPRWPHGDASAIRRVQGAGLPKTQLFNASFTVETNPDERRRCVEETGIEPAAPRPFEEHLADLASSYFCISPSGAGIDSHRTWEALYLRTIPVVTRSLLTEQHRDFPLIVLDDWSEFRSIDFSPALYERTLAAWTPAELSLDRYVARIEGLLTFG
jgi:hypothetical protein